MSEHTLRCFAMSCGIEFAPTHIDDGHTVGSRDFANVIEHIAVVTVGSDPDLVHPASTRDEKFTYGLSTFDLSAAEIIAAILGRATASTATRGSTGFDGTCSVTRSR